MKVWKICSGGGLEICWNGNCYDFSERSAVFEEKVTEDGNDAGFLGGSCESYMCAWGPGGKIN